MAKEGTAIVKAKPYQQAITERIDALREAGKLATIDAPEDALDTMVDRIMNASDEEDLLGGTTPIGQLVGRVIRVEEVNFRPSGYRDHDYAVFRWTATEGDHGITSNGGPRLVATLAKALELGRLPLTAKVDSAQVEYAEGQFGTTYFLTKAR